MRQFLREDLALAWAGRDPFEQAIRQQGEVFREREGRRTLRFFHDGAGYFLKYHGGIGWREISKNISQGKLPVVGAMQEVRAINAVRAAGLDTMTVAGYGWRGRNPARQESFLVTDELVNTLSLEEVGEAWLKTGNVPAVFKQQLIRRVAEIARRMHRAGINHRDFYLAHFLMPVVAVQQRDATAPLFLIDLHRSQVRHSVPRRWRVKDLGGLYFSSARFGLTRRDMLRFVREYSGLPLREAFEQDPSLWRACKREGEKVYRRYYEVEPRFPLQFNEHPGKDI